MAPRRPAFVLPLLRKKEQSKIKKPIHLPGFLRFKKRKLRDIHLLPYIFQEPVWEKKPLPTELWENIKKYLSPFYSGLLSQQFNIYPEINYMHEIIWYKIFKDDRWLKYVDNEIKGDPALVGPYLHKICLGEAQDEKDQYIVLVLNNVGPYQIQGKEEEFITRFFNSVHPHRKEGENADEITLYNGVRLNIVELYKNQNCWISIPLQDPRRIFQEGRLVSSYCFWTDSERRLRTIRNADVIGEHGEVHNLQDIREAFCLKLQFVACEREPYRDYGGPNRLHQTIFSLKNTTTQFLIHLGFKARDWCTSRKGRTTWCREVRRVSVHQGKPLIYTEGGFVPIFEEKDN
jgi:hypothetical protein